MVKKRTALLIQSQVVVDETPKILFVNYKISKGPDKSIQVELINTIVANGTFKNTDEGLPSQNKGDYVCLQLDSEGGIIDQLPVSNPLIKNIEHVNDEGTSRSKNHST